MQLYATFKINSNIPFPNLTMASNIFQPILPESISYINGNVAVSQKKLKQTKRRSKFIDKVFQSKNRSGTCANQECVGPMGLSSHTQDYGFHHAWIALGAYPPIPVKKLQNTVSPISFLWGDISSDKQIGSLLHKILRKKFI